MTVFFCYLNSNNYLIYCNFHYFFLFPSIRRIICIITQDIDKGNNPYRLHTKIKLNASNP